MELKEIVKGYDTLVYDKWNILFQKSVDLKRTVDAGRGWMRVRFQK